MRRGVVAVLVAAVLVGCMHERATVPIPTTPPPTPPSSTAGDPRLRFTDAVARVERGDDASARPTFVDLLRRYRELKDYHLAYLAAIDERADRVSDAATELDRLVDEHPDSVWVADALARRARIAATRGDASADALVARALTARGADDRTRAVALLVRADLRASTS